MRLGLNDVATGVMVVCAVVMTALVVRSVAGGGSGRNR